MEKLDQLNLTGNQLKLFLAVYDTNSVSRAAEEMGLNQSTTSYGIDRLRDALGDLLFVKSGRGITPTDKATKLVPAIRAIVDNLEALSTVEQYDPALDHSTIAISANVMELLPSLRNFYFNVKKEAPSAMVRLLELGSRDNVRKLLDENLVDIVISVRLQQLPNSLLSETIQRSEFVCFFDSSQRGPINNIQDYVEAEHATLDFGGEAKSTIDLELEKRSLTRKISLRVANAYVLGGVMKGTNLVCTMQKSLHELALSGLDYCPHPMDIPDARFDMIWHRRSDKAAKNVWLRQLLKRSFSNPKDLN